MKKFLVMTVAAGLLPCWLNAAALPEKPMLIESLEGPITTNELRAFKEFIRGLSLPKDNNHNAMVYGSAGGAAEGLGDVYEVTHDREILDLLINIADHMLAGRNDGVSGRLLWTGKRDLAWPNKPEGSPEAGYSGTENGDVLAHIALAAKLILEDKSLWDRKVGAGDGCHYGATYLERAKTFVRECDRTADTFLLPWFVNKESQRYYFPDSELYGKLGPRYVQARNRPVPWNQQMMFNGGFQRLAECHQLLGDEPGRVLRYDAIVKASMDWFLSDATRYQVNGHDCYKWSYGTENGTLRHVEDAGHGGYDILIWRAYASGRYGLTRSDLMPFANTAAFVLAKGNNQFAQRMDGSGTTRPSLGGTWLYLSDLLPELYPVIAKAGLDRARTRPETAARILWAKQRRCDAGSNSHRGS